MPLSESSHLDGVNGVLSKTLDFRESYVSFHCSVENLLTGF